MRLRGEFIEDPEQQRRLFHDVDEMQAMINSALEFFRDDARLEEATPSIWRNCCKPWSTITATSPSTSRSAARRAWCISAARWELKRVMSNLLENAIKYASEPAIEVVADAEQVKVCVLDRGPGIPVEWQEQVFEPFFRMESSRNRNTGGVGLGLSAARAIVLEHGGELRLRNRGGGGLEVCVLLPVQGI